MSAAPAAPGLSPLRAGTIRRVVRRGATHLCGLCRRAYRDPREAQGCVQQCWHDLLSLDPVIPRRAGLRRVYRCRFCARDHGGRAQAESCARECKAAILRAFDREQDLLDADDGPLPKKFKRRAPAPVVMRAAPRPAPKKKEKPAPAKEAAAEPSSPGPISVDVVEKPVQHALDPAPAPAPAAEASAPAAAGDEKKKDKRKGSDIFWRDGARYVCNVCSQKYFTKEEVTTCFDSHK